MRRLPSQGAHQRRNYTTEELGRAFTAMWMKTGLAILQIALDRLYSLLVLPLVRNPRSKVL